MAETLPSSNDRGSDPKQGFPWQMGVSLVGWFGMVVVLFVVGLGGGGRGGGTDADSSSMGSIRESLGSSYAAGSGGSSSAAPVLLTLAGFVVLVLTVLLVVRQGWARHALTAAGVLVVILLASYGKWEAVLAMAALVVGALPLLSRAANRYLA